MVFLKADVRSANRLTTILNIYSEGSGQCVIKQKSSVFFSSNCPDTVRVQVWSAVQIEREALTEKYLGTLTASGRITQQHFEHIVERARPKNAGMV
jgi:hypothetical protein